MMYCKKCTLIAWSIFLAAIGSLSQAQSLRQPQEVAATAMQHWKDSLPGNANGKTAFLQAIEGLWKLTADADYYNYIKHITDLALHNSDAAAQGQLPDGAAVLLLYKTTGDKKYLQAATALYHQMPGTEKLLYGTAPFYAGYAEIMHDDPAFNDLARKYLLASHSAIDSKIRTSYAMALTDALDHFPSGSMYRDSLIRILNRLAAGIRAAPGDPATSAYVLAKGVRKGYLPPAYLKTAESNYRKAQESAGQKGNAAWNTPEGAGTFILAGNEMKIASMQSVGKGKTVMLDYYFNSETRKGINGEPEYYHYTWENEEASGFSFWGNAFRYRGAKTVSLKTAPTAANLQQAAIYIIVDPDTEAENPSPNYVEPEHVAAVRDWVKSGGVLVLMSNDSINCEFKHFNQLAAAFGIHFNEDCIHHVEGRHYEQGAFMIPAGDPIFKTARKIYIKEMSTQKLAPPAKAIFTDHGDVIYSVARVGKGTVFAIGDPWLYNEYTDGRRLTKDYENYQSGCDLAKWLLRQAGATK